LSIPQRRGSSDVKDFWISAFAGMTFLGVAFSYKWIEKEEIVVTPKSKPNTIIREDLDRDCEDKLLEYDPEFLSCLDKAKEEYLKLGGLSIDDYLKKRRI
jgi:hypothetical protein